MGVSGQLRASRIYVSVDQRENQYRKGVSKSGHRSEQDQESLSMDSEVRWRYPALREAIHGWVIVPSKDETGAVLFIMCLAEREIKR